MSKNNDPIQASAPVDGDPVTRNKKIDPITPLTLATKTEKIQLSIYLLALSSILVYLTYYCIGQFNKEFFAEISTPFDMPVGTQLKAGTASLHYESQQKKLTHRGPISVAQQLLLRDLLEFKPNNQTASLPDLPSVGASQAASLANAAKKNEVRKTTTGHSTVTRNAAPTTSSTPASGASSTVTDESFEQARRSYYEAIDSLAYLSSAHQLEQIQLLLLLGLLGGSLGAVLRSLVDFVGNACYKNQLDLSQWWPLYFARPVVGAILGFVLVVLFKAKLLTSTLGQPSDESFWWLGMAVIGGFSTVDVTARLRIAAKALFGDASGERKS